MLECGEESARAIELAMREGGITPADVNYANLHGRPPNSTTASNPRPEAGFRRGACEADSHVGHQGADRTPQGASGAAGIAATLVAMQSGQIPPTINIETPDPDCDLDYVRRLDGRRSSTARFATALRWLEEFSSPASARGLAFPS